MAIPSPHPVESHSSLFQNASSNCVASNIVCFAQSLLIVLIASFFVPETATILSNIFSFFTSISNYCSPLFPVLFSRVYLKMQKVIHLSQLQKNFQTHSDFHFLPSVAILIDNTALFYILFSIFPILLSLLYQKKNNGKTLSFSVFIPFYTSFNRHFLFVFRNN